MQFIIYVKKSFPHSHQTKYSINQLLSPNDQAVEARYLEQNEDCKELIANIAKVSYRWMSISYIVMHQRLFFSQKFWTQGHGPYETNLNLTTSCHYPNYIQSSSSRSLQFLSHPTKFISNQIMSPSGRFENNDEDGQENEDILMVGIGLYQTINKNK